MKIIRQVPFATVVQSWLKAEWQDSFFDAVRNYIPQSLIDDEDFSNQQNNELRQWLLRTLRFPILIPLPEDVTWYSAAYEIADVGRTFIVPSKDWESISGNAYQPAAVLPNLNALDPHAEKIRSIKASLSSIDRRLVLVASDINSPLTIIEGNHRSVAILADAVKMVLMILWSRKSSLESRQICLTIHGIFNATSELHKSTLSAARSARLFLGRGRRCQYKKLRQCGLKVGWTQLGFEPATPRL